MASRFVISLAVAVLALAGCSGERAAPAAAARAPGWQLKMGNGTVASYADVDGTGNPTAIGVVWSATGLDGLPGGSDMHHCFGRNKDGEADATTKCEHTHEFVMPLPDAVARRDDVPFKWVLLNWNPEGHIPPGVYDVPHFDVHF